MIDILVEIEICQAIGIVGHEDLFTFQVFLHHNQPCPIFVLYRIDKEMLQSAMSLLYKRTSRRNSTTQSVGETLVIVRNTS
jgi:hypothetical protein